MLDKWGILRVPPLTSRQGFVDSRHSLLDLPGLSHYIQGETRFQSPEYRLNISRDWNRNADWLMYDALLEPVRSPCPPSRITLYSEKELTLARLPKEASQV